MGFNSKIIWTDHTFSPWWGCQKVGPGCDNCYAETLDNRTGGAHWGPGAEHRRTSVHNWNDPIRWNKREFFQCNACGKRGFGVPYEDFNQATGGKLDDGHSCDACGSRDMEPTRQRVFCASMADVFDNEVDPAWRTDLFDLIARTPNLDWLLLTKRIGNVTKMLPSNTSYCEADGFSRLWPHVWIGATICNQEEADRDIPKLLAVPAAKRFLSMEPLLGRVDLCEHLGMWWNSTMQCFESTTARFNRNPHNQLERAIDWVIVGGESGHKARPIHPDWARSLRDQCHAAGVAYFFKQWGEWQPVEINMNPGDADVIKHFEDQVARVGKKAAGRLLDGREWSEVPA